jgi:dienelactone hydrolase
MTIDGIDVHALEHEYHPVLINTNRGIVELRYYPVNQTKTAAIWVGGAGGGWDSPAHGLYPALCEGLQREQIASIRVRYRSANDLPECVLDVLAGMVFLEAQGVEKIALTGHSFGGAVVAQAAAHRETARTAILLSTQSYGVQSISELPAHCSSLFVHGLNDRVLPPHCSEFAHDLAHEPKRLVLYEGADHGLDEVRAELEQSLKDWIIAELSR